MRVALIGLGDIAGKAYLPYLTTRAGVTPCLVTRDARTLARVGDAYRVPERHRDLPSVLSAGIDAAFVHAATRAHHAIVGTLLRHDVPVYVDKPLDDTYAGAAELVELAERRRVPLMVGFNRRWAPAYRELADWPERDLVMLAKHRRGRPGEPRQVVFDDFIHVVDTLRFLGGGSLGDLTVSSGMDGGLLRWVAVHARTDAGTAFGVMHRDAGLTEEVLDVVGRGRRRRVVNLAEITEQAGADCRTRRDEWVAVAVQRGFAQLCDSFLDAVAAGRAVSARDALQTHAVCEEIVERVARRQDGGPGL
jgi:virulence factor